MYNSRLWVISPRTLKILFHCLLTFTADILVVYALWIFCFVPSHCVISEKAVLQNSKFCGKLEGRLWQKNEDRAFSAQISTLIGYHVLFCFFSSPNYVSVPSTVQDLAALKESTISRVCLPLLLHLFTFFPPPILKISFAFLPVKHGFWREVNTK